MSPSRRGVSVKGSRIRCLAASGAILALVASALGPTGSSARDGEHAAARGSSKAALVSKSAARGRRAPAKAASHRRRFLTRRRVRQIGGPPPCGAPTSSQPIFFETRTRATGSEFALGEAFFICFQGFDPTDATAPIDARVTLPNGQERNNRIEDPASAPAWLFLAYPPDPVGMYRVTATQGRTTTQATFTIRRPRRPRVELVSTDIQPGGQVQIVLSGFDRRERVDLRFYDALPSADDPNQPSIATYARGRRATRLRVSKRGFARRTVTAPLPGRHLIAAGGEAGPEFSVSDPAQGARATRASP